MKNKILIVFLAVLVLILASALIFWKPNSNAINPASPAPSSTGSSSSVEISGKITSILQNPEKIVVATNDGSSYSLLITSSTQVIRDVGGTVGGTFNFNSLHVGDLVGIQGNVDSHGVVTPSLVEQMNSQGIN